MKQSKPYRVSRETWRRELGQDRDPELGQDQASKLPHIGTDLWAQYVLLEERNNKQ